MEKLELADEVEQRMATDVHGRIPVSRGRTVISPDYYSLQLKSFTVD
jgi:hypothetical protein